MGPRSEPSIHPPTASPRANVRSTDINIALLNKPIIDLTISDMDEGDLDEADLAMIDSDDESEMGPSGMDADQDIMDGDVFEKAATYDLWLDYPNPWDNGLKILLWPSQVIGCRWMLERYSAGGGLVADKVGTGKV